MLGKLRMSLVRVHMIQFTWDFSICTAQAIPNTRKNLYTDASQTIYGEALAF